MGKQTNEKTCPIVTRAVIQLKQVDIRGSDWEKPKVGWSEKASKAIILETQIMRSRPSDDLGEEYPGQWRPWVSTQALSVQVAEVCVVRGAMRSAGS